MALALVTDKELTDTREWLDRFNRGHQEEVPTRIHETGHDKHFGLGAAPPFAPEFISYIGRLNCTDPHCKPCREDVPVYLEGEEYRARHSNPKTRVTRALRKLRRAAPTEFDVIYLAMRGHTGREIAVKLTERAIAGGHEERYDLDAVTVLAVLGVEKLRSWY